MCDKAGSRLPAIWMNSEDFSELTNEIRDWTDQSDKSLLCWYTYEYIHVSLRLSSVLIFTACCTCLLRRKCKRSPWVQWDAILGWKLLVTSWIKVSLRRIERIGRINKLARVIVIMRCNFRMQSTICQIEHSIFRSSNRTNRDSTCQVVNEIFDWSNTTNRPNRQTWKGSLSLMRCNFRMENTICQIVHNIFHSSNRTSRNSTCRVVNNLFLFAE